MFVLLQQSKYKVINKDQWCNVLEFSRLIKPDLSNYDEDGACTYSKLYVFENRKASVRGVSCNRCCGALG